MMGKQNGFTLVELLVAMAISSIIMGAILVTYQTQAKTHMTQQETVDMHQNARAAMDLMVREIRTAGLDPSRNAGAGIVAATSTYLHFTRDFDGGQSDGIDNDQDGSTDENDEWYDGIIGAPGSNEEIEYQVLYNATLKKMVLGRQANLAGGFAPVAANIEVLNFVYLDSDGNVIGTPVTASNLPNIRSIQVTLIARSDDAVQTHKTTDRTVYRNLQGDIILDKSGSPDTARRTLLSTTIQCRNLGL